MATPEGPRAIGQMRAGDAVLAYDFQQGKWVVDRVAEWHENVYDGPVVTLHTDAGKVETTVYHPFWVVDGRDLDERSAPRELEPHEDEGLSLLGRWVNSHDLRAGDRLVGRDGRTRTVLRVEQRYEPSFGVCNLTISEGHTFAVGPDAVLVHNTANCDGQIHHPISKPVHDALERHPNLKGQYTARDPRFTTQAVDDAVHRGYQKWHRALDKQVADWIRNPRNKNATPEQFEAWLRSRYGKDDLINRFPNGF